MCIPQHNNFCSTKQHPSLQALNPSNPASPTFIQRIKYKIYNKENVNVKIKIALSHKVNTRDIHRTTGPKGSRWKVPVTSTTGRNPSLLCTQDHVTVLRSPQRREKEKRRNERGGQKVFCSRSAWLGFSLCVTSLLLFQLLPCRPQPSVSSNCQSSVQQHGRVMLQALEINTHTRTQHAHIRSQTNLHRQTQSFVFIQCQDPHLLCIYGKKTWQRLKY